MSNSDTVSRVQLMYGLCLPLAVLLGFLLADPLEMSAVVVVGAVLALLCAPLLLKWYHPMMVFSWNASIAFAFLPGSPYLWMLLAVPSFVMGLLSRSTDPHRRFFVPPAVTWSLLSLVAVTVLTGTLTGGMGMRAMGSQQYGGRGYFYILFSVVGFFALTSKRIPANHASLFVSFFFLSGLTALAGHIIYLIGPKAYSLFYFFPWNWVSGQAEALEQVNALAGSARIGGFFDASVLLLCYLLARHGVRGTLDLKRPWRGALLLAAVVGVLYAGYRSAFILFGLTFAVTFFLEGLHRTRYMFMAVVATILFALLSVSLVSKMPYVVQRSLAFLPLNVDPMVQADVSASTKWRMEMWKDVLDEVVEDVPRYLLLGKGYGINPDDLELTGRAAQHGMARTYEGARAAGDYHSGPLTLFVPLGGLGTLAFVWFLVAGGRVLRCNYRQGDPALRAINRLLLAYFITRILFFLFVFGSFFLDLASFVGVVGLGLSLNAGLWQPSEATTSLVNEAATQYSAFRKMQRISKMQ